MILPEMIAKAMRDFDNSLLPPAYIVIIGAAIEALENTKMPDVYAQFECEDQGIAGTTAAPVKRVERNDDNSLTVFIDHWPRI